MPPEEFPIAILDVSPEVNVFTPEKDCAKVFTRPVAAVPAIGILNVWVAPIEEILNPLPDIPTTKVCDVAVNEFKVTRGNEFQVITPPEVETKYEVPIAGDEAGRV